MNPTLRYHILGKAYKKNVSNDIKQTKGSGTAHKKDYEDVDMLENVIGNINKMKFEDRKETTKMRTVKKNTLGASGGAVGRKRNMPLKFKFTV